jgi:CubicO group peptidase (beta-lactamase class C family)
MAGSPPRYIVPRADWDRGPWNRWAFQHVREIVPTAEVWRGDGPVHALPRDVQELGHLAVTGVDGAPTTLDGLLAQTFVDGFLVLKSGRVVFERYLNGMTPRTLHLSQSVAKSFTGVIAGILVERGVIDLSAPLTRYLPELVETAYAGATVQHVLDMTSGVAFDETYTDPTSDIGQVDVACGWKPPPPGVDPHFVWPAHMWELILGLTRSEAEHGSRFSYRSIETDVLAFALERATGKRLPQLLSELLWQPMGAAESACYTVDPAGFAVADGGLNACLGDYARFGQLLLEGGRGIIPAPWIEETRRGNHARFGGSYAQVLPQGAYHNQFWIEDAQSRNLMCRGVFGQLIHVNFDQGIVVAQVSSWPDFTSAVFEGATHKAIHRIAQALG